MIATLSLAGGFIAGVIVSRLLVKLLDRLFPIR